MSLVHQPMRFAEHAGAICDSSQNDMRQWKVRSVTMMQMNWDGGIDRLAEHDTRHVPASEGGDSVSGC